MQLTSLSEALLRIVVGQLDIICGRHDSGQPDEHHYHGLLQTEEQGVVFANLLTRYQAASTGQKVIFLVCLQSGLVVVAISYQLLLVILQHADIAFVVATGDESQVVECTICILRYVTFAKAIGLGQRQLLLRCAEVWVQCAFWHANNRISVNNVVLIISLFISRFVLFPQFRE